MAPKHQIEEAARTARVAQHLLEDYVHTHDVSPDHAEPARRAVVELSEELRSGRLTAWLAVWLIRAASDVSEARTAASVCAAIREHLEWAAE